MIAHFRQIKAIILPETVYILNKCACYALTNIKDAAFMETCGLDR
jgi:hypothetical protein